MSTERETPQTFLMDGNEHTLGKDNCYCSGKPCPECKGWMHYQPVYGGFYYECEVCGDKD